MPAASADRTFPIGRMAILAAVVALSALGFGLWVRAERQSNAKIAQQEANTAGETRETTKPPSLKQDAGKTEDRDP